MNSLYTPRNNASQQGLSRYENQRLQLNRLLYFFARDG
jgi:hypothetical protein